MQSKSHSAQQECSICEETFNSTSKAPKVLLCGHTYCQVCIDQLRKQSVDEGRPTFSCPHCRKEIDVKQEIPTNFSMQDNARDLLQEEESKEPVHNKMIHSIRDIHMTTQTQQIPSQSQQVQNQLQNPLATRRRSADFEHVMEQINTSDPRGSRRMQENHQRSSTTFEQRMPR